MSTRPTPADLGSILEDVLRRVADLERSNRIQRASIPAGGALVVLNNLGNPVVRIGTLNSGGYGIERWNGSAWVNVA